MIKTKKRNTPLVVLIVAFIIIGGLVAAYKIFLDPYSGAAEDPGYTLPLEARIRAKDAIKDLDYFVKHATEIHPLLVGEKPEAFEAAIEAEISALEALEDSVKGSKDSDGKKIEAEITVKELWQRASRIFHTLGDAHTMTGIRKEERRYIPMRFRWDGDVLLCLDEPAKDAALQSINGQTTEELYKKYESMFSYELESYSRASFAKDLSNVSKLQFLDVIDTEDTTQLEMVFEKDGKTFTVDQIDSTDKNPNKPENAQNEDYWDEISYRFDSKNKSAVFTIYSCFYDSRYTRTLEEFFNEVRKQETETVVLDLRGNIGGDSRVIGEFLRYLPIDYYSTGASRVRFGPYIVENQEELVANERKIPSFEGKVYVLTDAFTFSSATDFATTIQDNLLGKVVGEVPGNMPTSYGDVVVFQAPHSKVLIQVSYKYFIRPDQTKVDLPLIPDIEVPGEEALAAALADAKK